MTSSLPPRDWTDDPLARYRRGRACALDRGVAAGGDRAARPAFACRHRRHDRARPIWRGCASCLPRHYSGDFPAAAAGRHFHRTYRLSGHADIADRSRAEELDGARRERRARRHQKARDGDEPWRQQCGDDAGGAGSARAARTFGGDDELVAFRRAGGIVFSGGIAPRHPWRRGRNLDHAGAISANGARRKRSPIFVPPASRWKRNFAGCRRSGRRRSPGRRRIFTRAAPSAMPPRPPPRRASVCSITARARSANCSTRSITST